MMKIILLISFILILIIFTIVYLKNGKEDTLNNIVEKEDTLYDSVEKEEYKSDLQNIINNKRFESSFRIDNCNEIIFQKHSNGEWNIPEKEFLVNSKEIINKITRLLATLPEEGEMYINFGRNISRISMYFLCSDNKEYMVEIYGGSIKTPGTSFLIKGEYEGEKELMNLINSLVKTN